MFCMQRCAVTDAAKLMPGRRARPPCGRPREFLGFVQRGFRQNDQGAF